MEETIAIYTPWIQLQQLLKLTGETLTGGDAKRAVASGQVLVNGQACTQRGKKLRPGDLIQVGSHKFRVVEGK